MQRALQKTGIAAHCFIIPNGESSKNFELAQAIYDWLVGLRAERGQAIIAVGGGVVGDLAGFVAATFLRGGAFVDPGNQERMLGSGLVFCLSARPETILQRISQTQRSNNSAEGKAPVRPLLAGDDPLEQIKRLLTQRADAYARAHYTIETDNLTPIQVAMRVLELCQSGLPIPEPHSPEPHSRENQ